MKLCVCLYFMFLFAGGPDNAQTTPFSKRQPIKSFDSLNQNSVVNRGQNRIVHGQGQVNMKCDSTVLAFEVFGVL